MTDDRVTIPGWERIEADVKDKSCAQLVNGEWYVPKWGCDSLQETLEAPQSHISAKRSRRLLKSEIAEVKRQIEIFGQQLLVNGKLVEGDLIDAAKYIFDVLGLDYSRHL